MLILTIMLLIVNVLELLLLMTVLRQSFEVITLLVCLINVHPVCFVVVAIGWC